MFIQTRLIMMLILTTLAFPLQAYADTSDSDDDEATLRVLRIFEQISAIPRCSKQEDEIVAWLVEWAAQRQWPVQVDAYNNVLISVPAVAGYSDRPTVVLQAHTDMVCQKTANTTHDFLVDPIVPIRDGDWLRAVDTTLGADNGIGVAIALALAEDVTRPRPALELLFTADEEMDMTGAEGLSPTGLSGRKLINLDSEEEGTVTLGAAGGIKSEIMLPLNFTALSSQSRRYQLRIDGLLGGHSGLAIHKNRANANVLAAEVLTDITSLQLIHFSGGTVDNAITRSADVHFALNSEDVVHLQDRINQLTPQFQQRFPEEQNLSMTLTPLAQSVEQGISLADTAKALAMLLKIPQGVYEWSEHFPGLPETSNNIGIVAMTDGALMITNFKRSFHPDKLEAIGQYIEAIAATAGATSTRRSAFPTWPPNPNAALYLTALESYQAVFQSPLRTEVLHAGLECGFIAEKYPDMEIISIGPNIEYAHTPEERLYIPSVTRTLSFLHVLLSKI